MGPGDLISTGTGPRHTLRIETVEVRPDAVVLIDQLALPADERYVACLTWRDVAAGIVDMTVRGAPAIGVAAAGALALAAREAAFAHPDDRAAFDAALDEAAVGLARTRPTAVNLTWAIAEMRAVWQRCGAGPRGMLAHAAGAGARDPRRRHPPLLRHRRLRRRSTSTRATRSSRTATPARSLQPATARLSASSERPTSASTARISVFVDETRPWLQGARLTAWELGVEGIEYVVIADNMAGHFISRGEVAAVVVGADRIAANGDTANKIGTYTLSVLAKEHKVPFYVAAPLSTVDLTVDSGAAIPIEERDPAEVTSFRGEQVAPVGAAARHPAFDVTPAANVTAIVTEAGVLRPPYGKALRMACLDGACET